MFDLNNNLNENNFECKSDNGKIYQINIKNISNSISIKIFNKDNINELYEKNFTLEYLKKENKYFNNINELDIALAEFIPQIENKEYFLLEDKKSLSLVINLPENNEILFEIPLQENQNEIKINEKINENVNFNKNNSLNNNNKMILNENIYAKINLDEIDIMNNNNNLSKNNNLNDLNNNDKNHNELNNNCYCY